MRLLQEMQQMAESVLKQLDNINEDTYKFDIACIKATLQTKIESCKWRLELEKKIIEEAINE